MSSDDWRIESLKEEIASVEEAKRLTQKMADEQMQQLANLVDRLKKLNDSSSNALGQLPKVMQAIAAERNLGVMVVDSEGNVVLFNTAIQKLLGLQLGESSNLRNNSGFGFFLEDQVTPCPTGFLTWEHFQQEHCQKHFVKHPNVPEGFWVQLQSLLLMDDEGSAKAGAVVIVNDITEQVQIEQEIRRISDSLQQQITVIEGARAELNQLTAKLGSHVAPSARPAPETESFQPSLGPEEEFVNTILIVDDIQVNRKLLSIQLQKLGYEVDQAEDGAPAVELIKQKQYGLVFMDLDMPVMDGFQATTAIRRLDAESLQHTPVVAMTSYDREGVRERCLTSGMDDYICKGVTKKKLREIIQRCIRRKKSQPMPARPEPVLVVEEVHLDYQLVEETYGPVEAGEIIDLFKGTMRTLVGCLKFALEDRDLKSIDHFAFSFKGPCSILSLNPMVKLLEFITEESAKGNWERAKQGMSSLETMCSKVAEQLAEVRTDQKMALRSEK